MTAQIQTELGRLRRIVIHRPGPEIDLMLPENIEAYREGKEGVEPNPDYLLFDDLVLLSRIRSEHDRLTSVLRAACGDANTLELRLMVRDLLSDGVLRTQLIDEAVADEEKTWGQKVDPTHLEILRGLGPQDLERAFLKGQLPDGQRVFKWPAPNVLFARDLAAVVGQNVVLTYARKRARSREMILSRALARHHKAFEGLHPVDIGQSVSDPAIEGGDIMVLSPHQVAIGVGQRTNMESAQEAGRQLMQRGIEQVYLVELRVSRSTMHLDTVFTLVDSTTCLAHTPLIQTEGAVQIQSLERDGSGGSRVRSRTGSFLSVLAEDGLEFDAVACGGEDPGQQQREQWSDGANAFALAPSKILLYARNEHTLRGLNSRGFEVFTPEDFCRNATLLLSDPNRKVVVAIEGPELSRGRGGPRCLTLPIARDLL
jgi:arginine deiminase